MEIISIQSPHKKLKTCKNDRVSFNSSSSSAAHMRQWVWPALAQIMACRPFGAKPLSKSMLGYCLLDHKEKNSVVLQNIVCETAVILSRGRWNNLLPCMQSAVKDLKKNMLVGIYVFVERKGHVGFRLEGIFLLIWLCWGIGWRSCFTSFVWQVGNMVIWNKKVAKCIFCVVPRGEW